jgi:hypothetical protein
VADQPGNAPPEGLSENHQRRLLATAQYVDRLLSDIESMLSGVESPFAKYLDDIRPAQKAAVAASVVRLRADLLSALAAEGIQPGPPRFSALHTIRTNLGFIEIALEELKPRYMRGYGEMPRTAGATLETIVEDLQDIVRKVDAVLAEPL